MVEVLYANLKSPFPHTVDEIWSILVAPLRDQLKRGFNAKRLVNVHQSLTIIQPGFHFHVVSHHDTTAGAVGPEPHKRNPPSVPGSEGQKQQSLANVFNGSVYGPARKTRMSPTSRVKPLNSSPDWRSHQRTQKIIES